MIFQLQENLIFWTAVSFSILLIVLARFGFKPITDILAERERRIRESLEQAEHTRLEAERLLREYEKRIAEARTEAQKMIAEGKELGENLKGDIIQKAHEEADRLLAGAQEQIARDVDKAVAELKAEMAQLSVDLASKIIGRSLEKGEHEELVEKYLDKVSLQ